MKKKRKIDAFAAINGILMLIFTLVCIYPFYYVLIVSLNDPLDAQRGGLYLWVRSFSIENYKAIFKTSELLNAYQITLFRVIAGSALHLILTAMFAFALTKKHFVFRKFLSWWMLIPMYFSGGIIPTYVVMDMLGLVNNVMVYILPHLLATFHILILRTFLNELPAALEESAVIDGASDFSLFWRIVMPLSTPVGDGRAVYRRVSLERLVFRIYLYDERRSLDRPERASENHSNQRGFQHRVDFQDGLGFQANGYGGVGQNGHAGHHDGTGYRGLSLSSEVLRQRHDARFGQRLIGLPV